LHGELGQIGGGVISAALAARFLANRVEYRVGYGENWSYPPPWRGAAGTLKADGEGGGGVLAILNFGFDNMWTKRIFEWNITNNDRTTVLVVFDVVRPMADQILG